MATSSSARAWPTAGGRRARWSQKRIFRVYPLWRILSAVTDKVENWRFLGTAAMRPPRRRGVTGQPSVASLRRQEPRRVDEAAIQRHPEVQVRSGYAAGGADLADDVAALDHGANLHADQRQVAVHRDQPLAVLDQHRVAVEKIQTGIDHLAIGGGGDWCAGCRRDIHAAVRVARLVVEETTQAKGTGARAADRRPQPQCRGPGGGKKHHGTPKWCLLDPTPR